jgi:hypothetical protein
MPQPSLAVIAQLDPVATADATRNLTAVDPECCNACATLLQIVQRGRLPVALAEAFAVSGADPLRAVDVWGAPEQGFLQAVWWLVGELPEPAPSNGWTDGTCHWKVGRASRTRAGTPFAGGSTLELEVTWDGSEELIELERSTWSARA